MFNNRPRHSKPSVPYAFFIVFVLLFIILGANRILQAPLNPMFLIAWLFLYPACMYLGYTYQEINESVLEQCKKGMTGVMIIISVGALISTWIAAGCVPSIIYYGLNLVNPKFFLLATFLLCLIVSTACGTSWGAAATAGVAMFAIGESLDVPAAMTVGAICSGSFFGDMISPMSDSANIAALSVGTDLINQCKKEVYIAVPAMIVTGIIYFIMGLSYSGGNFDPSVVTATRESIARLFHTGFISFIPMILLFILLFKKVPALFAMLISALSGGVIAVCYQGLPATSMFNVMWKGYSISSGEVFIDTLFNRGGMVSMASTVMLLLFSYGVIGTLNKVGILDTLVSPLVDKARNAVTLTLISQFISIIGVMLGTGGVSLLLTGSIMSPAYKKFKLHPVNLSKAINATATPWNAMIPWNISGIYIAGLFNVGAFEYGKYFIFAFVMPLMVLLFVILKIQVTPAEEEAVISPKGLSEAI